MVVESIIRLIQACGTLSPFYMRLPGQLPGAPEESGSKIVEKLISWTARFLLSLARLR